MVRREFRDNSGRLKGYSTTPSDRTGNFKFGIIGLLGLPFIFLLGPVPAVGVYLLLIALNGLIVWMSKRR